MVSLAGCTVFTHVPKGQHLVTKVRIKGAPNAHREGLMGIVEEKPNTRILGVWRLRTRNWYVQQTIRKNDDKPTIWEPPTYHTDEGTLRTSQKMEQYLKNNGYFNAGVEYSVAFGGLRDKKARITYEVSRHKPYTIAEVLRSVEDKDLYEIVERDKANSLIKSRKVFNTDQLVAERERLLFLLRNAGYYRFSREYIYFDLDSSKGNHQIDIRIGIKNPEVYQRHQPYRVGKMYFVEKDAPDSHTVEIAPGLYRAGANNRFVDELLMQALAIHPGDTYNQDEVQATLRNLRNIQLYEYVDVAFELKDHEGDTGLVDLRFLLSPYMRRSIQAQAETITSEQNRAAGSPGRLYGLAGSLVYRDVNFANRGIQMETRLRMAWEASGDDNKGLSNYEANIANTYYFARPFLGKVIPTGLLSHIARSSVNLSGIYESNPDFSRTTATVGLAYQLLHGRFKHYVLPIDFNMVSSLPVGAFATTVEENPALKNLFDNHIICGARWGMYYSNNVIGSKRNHVELSANILEVAGNLFYLVENVTNTVVDDLKYFQYLKFDYDLRYHLHTFWDNEVVYRVYVGMIHPYGNTPNEVPYEKRYYTGGANSVRGWRLRQLGPGKYDGSEEWVFYHSGNIRLEANMEYRFSISNLLKMAAFVDAGNVWNSDVSHFDEILLVEKGAWPKWGFYKELAVAGGLGFRFDFTYFVFRTDVGLPLYKPYKEAWFKYGVVMNDVQLNVGIGYPF